MFSNQSGKQLETNIIEELIQHHYDTEQGHQELTLDSEYQSLVGKEYNELKQNLGGVTTQKEQLRKADLEVAQSLYIGGHDSQEIVKTVMRKSPALRQMSQREREKHQKKLLKAMRKAEPQREKMQKQKQVYGIDTNCRRDINNYLKCMKAEQKARSQGMMIPHLNYRQFQKKNVPNFHKKYIANIEAKVAKQDKLDKERQQKQQEQKQQKKQQEIEQKRQIKRSR